MKINIKISIITSLYRGEKYLDGFFKNFLQISNLPEVELIIIHNDPIEEEKRIILHYKNEIPNLQILEVPLEGVYRSWNRAIQHSKGKYLAMWNVDDMRIPNSLEKQSELLDKNEDCVMVTGDYYKVFKYGNVEGYLKKDNVRKGVFNKVPKFNNGCFLMWRKSVHEDIGFFDEQFKVGGDWEFWMRVASNYKVCKIYSILGFYLRESNIGISKSKENDKDLENAIIKIRYYSFYFINIYKYLNSNKEDGEIKLNRILNFSEYKSLKPARKKTYFSFILSALFFWVPNFNRIVVEIKYRLFSQK